MTVHRRGIPSDRKENLDAIRGSTIEGLGTKCQDVLDETKTMLFVASALGDCAQEVPNTFLFMSSFHYNQLYKYNVWHSLLEW